MESKDYAESDWQLFCGKPIDQRKITPKFDELGEHTQAFTEYYAKNIEPICEQCESERIKALLETKTRYRYFLIPAVALSMLLHYLIVINVPNEIVLEILLTIFAYLVPIVGCIFYCSGPRHNFQNKIGDTLYKIALRYFGDKYEYSEINKQDIEHYADYRLLPSFDKAGMGAYLSGEHRSLDFSVQQLALYVRDGTDKNDKPRYKTIFSGIGIEIDHPKTFHGLTVVATDKGMFGNFTSRKKGLERVRLEDPTFESAFEVYGTDQVEARYLLSVATMELFLDLTKKYGSHIQASFYQGKLLLLIPTTHPFFKFRANIMKPIVFDQPVYDMFRDITLIHQMIDTLKLKNRSSGEELERQEQTKEMV
ncbi:DUF3137 domain-containing protein [Vibrio renipiscarius]|uniref:Galanin n=1 Tax=Vibrio renipiscarius TaxID=1461322 RepID=A0A0C2NVP4_9VIBR|nr:DUF3137 domain-containing protein [Vibrio renipiscarius]KII76246.1 hypothetical protein OJ16_15665 [Vibrio renipiscarius]KII78232.1 hypothetical protein PL18_14905 [Vibrio renipiscarius]